MGGWSVEADDEGMTKTKPSIASIVRRAAVAVAAATTAVSTLFAAPAHAVVGGYATTGNAHPYYVRLSINGAVCGGSLIEHATVLTAAHCADSAGGNPANITAFIKDNDQLHVPVTSIEIHPLWNGHAEDGHDLAILHINPGNTTSGITPVQVGTPSDPGAYAVNTPATLVGRGQLQAGGAFPTQLQQLDTVLHSDEYMDDLYNPWYWFDYWNETLMIGAGWSNQTACHGDSGGPLTVVRNGVRVQVGLVSFVHSSPDCADPAGYAELAGPQLAWVASKVPSIWKGWGGCTTPSGVQGEYHAYYHAWWEAAQKTDGKYYWDIYCTGIYQPPTTTQSPTTTKPKPDEPPLPAYCTSKPWLSGCGT